MGNFDLLKIGIVSDLRLQSLDSSNEASLENELAAYIDELIQHNFALLIELIYRVDISESKLQTALNNIAGENSSLLIARMMIERQLEKIATRERYSSENLHISDDEKW